MYICVERTKKYIKDISIVPDEELCVKSTYDYIGLEATLNSYFIEDACNEFLLKSPNYITTELFEAIADTAARYICGYFGMPQMFKKIKCLLYTYICKLSPEELKKYPYLNLERSNILDYFN